MEDGALTFIFIGLGIIVFAMVVARLLRRTLRRQMPGRDPHNNSTFWYGAGGRDGSDGGDGGSGG